LDQVLADSPRRSGCCYNCLQWSRKMAC